MPYLNDIGLPPEFFPDGERLQSPIHKLPLNPRSAHLLFQLPEWDHKQYNRRADRDGVRDGLRHKHGHDLVLKEPRQEIDERD